MKKAILHIDLHAPYYDPTLRGIFNRCAEIGKAARYRNIDNIWVGVRRDDVNHPPMTVKKALDDGLLPAFKAVQPAITETLLLKNTPGLFTNPHAATFFREKAYDEIYVTGVYAMGCVFSTIKGAFRATAQWDHPPFISVVIDAIDATKRIEYEDGFMPRMQEGRHYMRFLHENLSVNERMRLGSVTSKAILDHPTVI